MGAVARAQDLGLPKDVFDSFDSPDQSMVTLDVEGEKATFSPQKVMLTLSSGLLAGTDEELMLAALMIVFFRTRDWDLEEPSDDPNIREMIDFFLDERTLAPDVARYFREMGKWNSQPEEGQHR